MGIADGKTTRPTGCQDSERGTVEWRRQLEAEVDLHNGPHDSHGARDGGAAPEGPSKSGRCSRRLALSSWAEVMKMFSTTFTRRSGCPSLSLICWAVEADRAVRPGFHDRGDITCDDRQFSVAPNLCTALLGHGSKDGTENGGADVLDEVASHPFSQHPLMVVEHV